MTPSLFRVRNWNFGGLPSFGWVAHNGYLWIAQTSTWHQLRRLRRVTCVLGPNLTVADRRPVERRSVVVLMGFRSLDVVDVFPPPLLLSSKAAPPLAVVGCPSFAGIRLARAFSRLLSLHTELHCGVELIGLISNAFDPTVAKSYRACQELPLRTNS